MISTAFAQSAGPAGGFSLGGLIPFILIFVIFYFLLIRPQQKKVKEHKNMVQNLKRGDTIVTAGGMVGKIVKASDNSEEITVEISKGINVNVVRHMVSDLKTSKK
ncbi:MAG: preprotein translocase subunit YajC [SAR116 cluster bacterium]|nr:preprotein translocase subunit YajC [SAR116 cluster bacterium]RPH10009.1 MAG: preprotein translocase subunit YajC [Alphaproteobacteria bacterium TMED54]|tara:strand:+ start:250 stop:564 length:315 start_codon:yes stop_codon:yes gene_type:complete